MIIRLMPEAVFVLIDHAYKAGMTDAAGNNRAEWAARALSAILKEQAAMGHDEPPEPPSVPNPKEQHPC